MSSSDVQVAELGVRAARQGFLAGPAGHGANLARALLALAVAYDEARRPADALRTVWESVAIFRWVIHLELGDGLVDLAASLKQQLLRQVRALVPADRSNQVPLLAHLAEGLTSLKRHDEALECLGEAHALIPNEHRQASIDFAAILRMEARCHYELEHYQPAQEMVEMALAILGDAQEPHALVQRAAAYDLLARCHGNAKRTAEAVEAARRAVECRRQWSGTPPEDLAYAWNRLAWRYHEADQIGEALAALHEAIQIFRGLASPFEFAKGQLALALNNRAIWSLEHPAVAEVALGAAHESVELYRWLSSRRPGWEARLANALDTLADVYAAQMRHPEATSAAHEALALVLEREDRTRIAEYLDNYKKRAKASGSTAQSDVVRRAEAAVAS